MKGVIVSLFIAAALIAGSIAYTNHIDNVSQQLGKINGQIMQSLENGDFDIAGDGIKRLGEYLDKNRTVLAATGNHEEFDKIEMNISELTAYTDGMHQTDAISSCRVLSFLFEHLPKNYEIKLENIL